MSLANAGTTVNHIPRAQLGAESPLLASRDSLCHSIDAGKHPVSRERSTLRHTSSMKPLHMLLDRTAVLFLGIAAGAAIGFAFVGGESGPATMPAAIAPSADGEGAKVASCQTHFELPRDLERALEEGQPIDVGVFGDSFGDGIWAGFYNEFRDVETMTVHRFTKQSTGFTRYKSLNLLDDARDKLAAQPVDLAVLSFGANDTWDIWEEGKLMPYMSADWQRLIGDRIRAYIEQLEDSGASVVWIGLPSMRKPVFNEQVVQMNEFNRKLMCELKVPFIDTLQKSLDDDGNYTEMLQKGGEGAPIRARAEDGIHMTMTGYRILIEDMTKDIRDVIPTKPEPSERNTASGVAE